MTRLVRVKSKISERASPSIARCKRVQPHLRSRSIWRHQSSNG